MTIDVQIILTYLALHNQSNGQCDGWVVRKLGIIWIHLLCTAQRGLCVMIVGNSVEDSETNGN